MPFGCLKGLEEEGVILPTPWFVPAPHIPIGFHCLLMAWHAPIVLQKELFCFHHTPTPTIRSVISRPRDFDHVLCSCAIRNHDLPTCQRSAFWKWKRTIIACISAGGAMCMRLAALFDAAPSRRIRLQAAHSKQHSTEYGVRSTQSAWHSTCRVRSTCTVLRIRTCNCKKESRCGCAVDLLLDSSPQSGFSYRGLAPFYSVLLRYSVVTHGVVRCSSKICLFVFWTMAFYTGLLDSVLCTPCGVSTVP